jgi:hypothetical protein
LNEINFQPDSLQIIDASFLINGLKMLDNFFRDNYFEGYKVGVNSYKFSSLKIEGELDIRKLHPSGSYQFQNCTFTHKIALTVYETKVNFEFTDCVLDTFELIGGKYLNRLFFIRCKCNSFYIIKGHFSQLVLNLYECKVTIVGKSHFDRLSIEGKEGECKLKSIILNTLGMTGTITIGRSYINHLSIGGRISSDLSLRIYSCFAFQVSLAFLQNDGSLAFEFVSAKSKHILKDVENEFIPHPQFTNEERIAAKTYYTQSFFSVRESNLGKAQFSHIDFSSYNEVSFFQSKLSDIEVANIKWPSRVIALIPPNPETYTGRFKKGYRGDEKEVLVERENYRQMKFICSKHQDYIGEQHFHGLEMRAYYRSLTAKNAGTMLIIFLSYTTSNFGQSIARPIVSILVINGFLFYLLYCIDKTPFAGYDFQNLNNYINTAAEFIRVVNPLHNNSPELTGWAFIVDVAIRVCSSYFLYNLIRATRRFVK